jgi:hypothetical protein
MHITTDAEPVIARDATDAPRSVRAPGAALYTFSQGLVPV